MTFYTIRRGDKYYWTDGRHFDWCTHVCDADRMSLGFARRLAKEGDVVVQVTIDIREEVKP